MRNLPLALLAIVLAAGVTAQGRGFGGGGGRGFGGGFHGGFGGGGRGFGGGGFHGGFGGGRGFAGGGGFRGGFGGGRFGGRGFGGRGFRGGFGGGRFGRGGWGWGRDWDDYGFWGGFGFGLGFGYGLGPWGYWPYPAPCYDCYYPFPGYGYYPPVSYYYDPYYSYPYDSSADYPDPPARSARNTTYSRANSAAFAPNSSIADGRWHYFGPAPAARPSAPNSTQLARARNPRPASYPALSYVSWRHFGGNASR